MAVLLLEEQVMMAVRGVIVHLVPLLHMAVVVEMVITELPLVVLVAAETPPRERVLPQVAVLMFMLVVLVQPVLTLVVVEVVHKLLDKPVIPVALVVMAAAVCLTIIEQDQI